MLPYIYLLKVIVCSAIFMGYYFVVLRNKIYHQYNRFYLLFATLASWCIPLLQFNIVVAKAIVYQPVFEAITYIASSNKSFEPEPIYQPIATHFTTDNYIVFIYIVLAAMLMIAMLYAIAKIFLLTKKYPKENINNCPIYLTKEENTPFSFFKFIFWNTDINIHSNIGNQILQHELTHIKQKHSWDKIFIQLNIIAGWFNPFFWLIKKELEMIHEFIADKKSVPNANTAEFAAMLLNTAFGTKQLALTNPFFFSPIKRRLIMLTKNTHPKFSYLQRIIALPLLALAIILFSFKVKDEIAKSILTKKYKVVIDAGHGGTDFGAKGVDGKTYEKDIALVLAKMIKEQNTNNNIEIVLSRNEDVLMNPKEKVEFSNNQNADLFVSLHCNYESGSNSKIKKGTEIFVVSKEKDNGFKQESEKVATGVNTFLTKDFKSNGIKTRQVGIWVLQATKCPSILIETGFISNKEDLKILKNKDKQQLMANDILLGIESYFGIKENGNVEPDTIVWDRTKGDKLQVVKSTINNEIKDNTTEEEMQEYKQLVEK